MLDRYLLDINDLKSSGFSEVLDLSQQPDPPKVLAGKGVALLFEKPSARTRNSMEMAVVQLGGHPAYIQPHEVGLGTRESAEDVARTLACYYDIIGARVFTHKTVTEMVNAAGIPVINLLSDESHPMQALADVLTLRDEFGSDLNGCVLAYVGDANNVAQSLALACGYAGVTFRIASPAGYGFKARIANWLHTCCRLEEVSSPAEAVDGADAVYTDVWTSMGQETEADQRRKAFAGFTVDAALMQQASPGAIFLHCLPAHRGEEVAAEVIDGEASRVWQQAANRMHAARGVLLWLKGERPTVRPLRQPYEQPYEQSIERFAAG